MKSLLTSLLIVCVLSSFTFAQDEQTKTPAPESDETKVSAEEDAAKVEGAETTTVDSPQEPKKPPAPLPFILRPYEIKVFLTVNSQPAFSNGADARIAEGLKDRLQSAFRQMWNVDVVLNEPAYRYSARDLVSLTNNALDEKIESAENPSPQTASTNSEAKESNKKKDDEDIRPDTLNNRMLALEQDKLFLATIHESSGEYHVHLREWDASSQTLGSLHHHSTFDRRLISSIANTAVAESFRPLAELEIIDGEHADYLIRAGELYPRDTALMQFQVGDFLTPYMRYLNRKREVQRITTIPWTYMRVEEITRSRIHLKMTSAFSSPIPLSRRRVEVMGMRIKPHLKETTIQIYPRGSKLNPLVGVRCEIMERLPTKDNPVPDEEKTILTTDRDGTIRVSVNAEHPLQYVVVYSGASTLARVPFIPGDQPYLEVEVPDDTARLTVEGEVALLQSELIDIIATREVLFARARGAGKKKDWQKVDLFVKELEELQTFEQYQTRIETLRVQAVYAAQQAKDRVAEGRIKKLCDSVLESAQKHLDPFRIAEFRREMKDLRRDS